jgi:hypothetical protein
MQKKLVQFRFGLLIARGALHQFSDVPRHRCASEPTSQAKPHPYAPYLCDRIEGPPGDEGKIQFGEGFHAPAEATGRLANPLRDRLEFPARCREQGQHAIGLAEAETRGNHGQRRRALTCRHGAQGSIALQARHRNARRNRDWEDS